MHNSQKPIKNGANSIVSSTTNSKINNGRNLNATQRNRIQSDSNNVFHSNSSNVDTDFTTVQHKTKRNLSTNSNDKTETIKKNKPFFASSNKYAVLANENDEIENSDEILIDIDSDTEAEQKVKPLPPIFISGLLEPPACVLCGGNHIAHYRGCQVHKNLQSFQNGKNTPNKKYNLRNYVKYNSIVKKGEDSGVKTNLNHPNINDTSSFLKLSSQSHHPNTPKHTLPNDTENQSESNLATQLSSFISEFKLIINPLISLLTTVKNKLIINVNK